MVSLDDAADTVDSGTEKLADTTAVVCAAKAQADEVVDQLGSASIHILAVLAYDFETGGPTRTLKLGM